jgi:hypothetical protein
MEKTLINEQQRIFEIMSQVDELFITPELHNEANKLMKSLRNNINNIGDILHAHLDNGKMVFIGEINNIRFSVHFSHRIGELEGIYLFNIKTNVKGHISVRALRDDFDDVLEAISDLEYQDS